MTKLIVHTGTGTIIDAAECVVIDAADSLVEEEDILWFAQREGRNVLKIIEQAG